MLVFIWEHILTSLLSSCPTLLPSLPFSCEHFFNEKIPTSGSAFREFYLRWCQSQPWEIDSKNLEVYKSQTAGQRGSLLSVGGVLITDRRATRIPPVSRWGIDSFWLATAVQWLRIALLVSRGIGNNGPGIWEYGAKSNTVHLGGCC